MQLKNRSFSLILVLIMLLSACVPPMFRPQPTPLPLPTELASTPLPANAQPGTLDSTFVSLASTAGAGKERCYKLFRFYPDGMVVYANFSCFENPPGIETWQDVYAWFNRENKYLYRGDYFTAGDQIWIRIVQFNPITERITLRNFQGQYCDNDMVLQEPAVRDYSGVPSPITQPVLEFANIRPLAPHNSEDCEITRFTILFRSYITLSGGESQFEVQTRPFETCTMDYTPPVGERSSSPIQTSVIADDQGICRWQWAVGDQVGIATITITIGAITQQFAIDIR